MNKSQINCIKEYRINSVLYFFLNAILSIKLLKHVLNFQFLEKQFIRMTKYTSNNKNQTYKLCIGILFTRLVTTILYNQSTEGGTYEMQWIIPATGF